MNQSENAQYDGISREFVTTKNYRYHRIVQFSCITPPAFCMDYSKKTAPRRFRSRQKQRSDVRRIAARAVKLQPSSLLRATVTERSGPHARNERRALSQSNNRNGPSRIPSDNSATQLPSKSL